MNDSLKLPVRRGISKDIMKHFLIIIVALVATGCMHTSEFRSSHSRIIEEAVLWKADIDERWVSLELLKLLEENGDFQESGNFYKVKEGYYAFGHPVKYLGVMGFGEFKGPNVTVIGTRKRVADNIAETYNIEMKTENDGKSYYCDLKKDFVLIVAEYPNKPERTVVLGAYTGL